MGKLRLKYLLKYQQGGGVTTFAPQPRNYVMPVQGINPAVLQYDIKTAPIDTSQLTQVMQFDSNLRFQKNKIEKETALEREKLQFQKDKLDAEMSSEWYKQIANEFKTAKAINKEVTGTTLDEFDRMENAPFYLSKDANYRKLLQQKEDAYKKLLTSSPFDTKNLIERKNIDLEIENIAPKLPMFSQLRADDRLYGKLSEIYTNEKSDIKLHNQSFLDFTERRLSHRETGDPNYKLGEGFKAMYSMDGESKNYQSIINNSRKSYEENITRIENGMIVSDKQTITPDNQTAARMAAESVLNSPSTFYYMDENIMGGALFNLSPEDRKKALEQHFLAKMKEDDPATEALNSKIGSEFKGQLPKGAEGNKTVTFNYNVPGKTQSDPNSILNSFGLDAGQKAVVAQALLKAKAANMDVSDPFYVAKVANEVLSSYDPLTKTSKSGLSDEALARIKAEGEAAISKDIRAKLNSNPVISKMGEEDKRLAATFLANPALQDAFYNNVIYPKEVAPLFNKLKTGQITLHESLKKLNDNQLKYIIHHEGPTGGLYYLKYGKVDPKSKNPNSAAEIAGALEKLSGTQDLPFVQALKDKNVEGAYDDVYGGEIDSSAIGAYGITFKSHKQDLIDFLNGNKDLVIHTPDLGVSDASQKDGGKVYELIGTTKVFDDKFIKDHPALYVKADDQGREWLYAPEDNESAQKALVDLGLLDPDTGWKYLGWPDLLSDVNVNEVGNRKVPGLTVDRKNKLVKIAVRGTSTVKPKVQEEAPKPSAEENKNSQSNPFVTERKSLMDSLGRVNGVIK